MSSHEKSLDDLIAQVRARIRARSVLKGLAITAVAGGISLVLAALVAGRPVHSRVLLVILRLVPLAVAIVSTLLFIVRPLRIRVPARQIARLVEEKCVLSERLSTTVECTENPGAASPAIVARLVEDTAARCSRVRLDEIVDPRRAYAYGAVCGLVFLAILGSFLAGPTALTTGMASLYAVGDVVAANSKTINVTPGTARAPRGSDQQIKAALLGFDAASAQVFIRRNGADVWEAHQMEPARKPNEFQFVIFNIQESIGYYVEAGGIRSEEFALEVADLPFVKQIDLVLTFPSYTRMPAKRIENTGEIAALKGTVAQVIANLSAKTRAARIILSDGSKIEMTGDGENRFTGSLTVKQSGTYRIELTSEDGERYNGSNEFDITVLEDHAPTVIIDKPGRDMKVTSIQEVFSQVRAEDDFGVASIELYYSVNGGDEKHVQLQDLKNDTPRALSGAHTFFLEEFGLQPGDFISYYAKARDNGAEGGQSSTSDIYFLEVRPFDRNFKQAQQQGGGGEGGEQDSNALTRRQREIIAATFRVQREQNNYTPQERNENFSAVTLSQEKLKMDAETLVERIRRRLGGQLNAQPQYAKLVEYVTQATKEMEGAIPQLHGQKPKEALPPEQRSLQQLLRAEAIFREIQIAQGNAQGGGQQQQEQDMADLFELQLDKMKNQYETVQRQQREQQSQQQDDIARRLAELARRQQQQIEQRMRQQQQGGGGGGGASQRQQQETIDEAQRLARELEQLSRDRRDPKLEEAARQLQQSADEMRRSQAASSAASSQQSSQQGSQQSSQSSGQASAAQQRQMEAQAQAMRALERMEQARKMLESAQRAGGQRSLQQLRQQAEDALKRQDEIGRSVDEMARGGQAGATEQKKEQVTESKQALADKIAGLERDLDQTARSLGQDKQGASDKLREAANGIRNNRIADRIRQNGQLIENGYMDQARDRERIIRGNIEDVVKNIQAAEGSAGRRTQGESLEEALNRARELADNLESLRRRMESQNGEQPGRDQQAAQQGNQQAGQQGNQQSQSGQQGEQGGRPGQQQNQAGRQGGQNGSNRQANQPGQEGRGQQGRQTGRGKQQAGQQTGQQANPQGGQQSGQQAGRQSGQQAGQQSGQQAGQQSGQQAGQQSGQQGGQQAGRGQQSAQGGRPSESAGAEDPSQMGGGPPQGGGRQIESELRERLKEADELRRALGPNADLARDLNRVVGQLRQINPNAFSDPSQLAKLKSEVIEPLRQLEIELARRLQARLGNNGSGALSDGEAPDRYRKLIEEYYRRLSARSPETKP